MFFSIKLYSENTSTDHCDYFGERACEVRERNHKKLINSGFEINLLVYSSRTLAFVLEIMLNALLCTWIGQVPCSGLGHFLCGTLYRLVGPQ